MEREKNSGYSKLIPAAKKIFAEWNHDKISKNFPQVKCDEKYIYLNFIYQPFKLDKENGNVYKIIDNCDKECDNPFEIMSIMDMLCSEKPFSLSGEWCPISYFNKVISLGDKAEKELYASYGRFFSENISGLRNACLDLGGMEYIINKSADVSIRMDLFDFFPVIFQFWDKDDEFPPQIKTLWDQSTMDFLLFETIFYALSCLLEKIKQSPNLSARVYSVV